jgi:hypothetical protein
LFAALPAVDIFCGFCAPAGPSPRILAQGENERSSLLVVLFRPNLEVATAGPPVTAKAATCRFAADLNSCFAVMSG